jgi:hypothetical protein
VDFADGELTSSQLTRRYKTESGHGWPTSSTDGRRRPGRTVLARARGRDGAGVWARNSTTTARARIIDTLLTVTRCSRRTGARTFRPGETVEIRGEHVSGRHDWARTWRVSATAQPRCGRRGELAGETRRAALCGLSRPADVLCPVVSPLTMLSTESRRSPGGTSRAPRPGGSSVTVSKVEMCARRRRVASTLRRRRGLRAAAEHVRPGRRRPSAARVGQPCPDSVCSGA